MQIFQFVKPFDSSTLHATHSKHISSVTKRVSKQIEIYLTQIDLLATKNRF